MSKTFQPPTRMGQNSWNVVGMQLEVLERSWNIQEWTKNFHSNCIPVHSSSSVIGVLGKRSVLYAVSAHESVIMSLTMALIWGILVPFMDSSSSKSSSPG